MYWVKEHRGQSWCTGSRNTKVSPGRNGLGNTEVAALVPIVDPFESDMGQCNGSLVGLGQRKQVSPGVSESVALSSFFILLRHTPLYSALRQ